MQPTDREVPQLYPNSYTVSNGLYRFSIEDLIKMGGYGDERHADPRISSTNFHTVNPPAAKKVRMYLVPLDGIDTDQVLVKLSDMKLRPGNIKELLRFGGRFPQVRENIMALGSTYFDPTLNCLLAPELTWIGHYINLCYYYYVWPRGWLFLALDQ